MLLNLYFNSEVVISDYYTNVSLTGGKKVLKRIYNYTFYMNNNITQEEAKKDLRVIYNDPRFSRRQVRPAWEYRKLIYETLVRHYTQGLTTGEISKLTGFPKKKLKNIFSSIVNER
jgi:hypothetical protein